MPRQHARRGSLWLLPVASGVSLISQGMRDRVPDFAAGLLTGVSLGMWILALVMLLRDHR